MFQGLREALGIEKASTLMELLPPVGWADVATKRDLDQHRLALSADIDLMGSELRGEMSALSGELRGEMSALSGELRGDISSLRVEMFREQRNQIIALIGANTTITALLLAAFRLL